MTAHSAESETPRAAPADVTLGQILTALGGPLVWAVHFMVTYLAAEGACRLGRLGGPWLGLTGLGWLAVATTVPAFALSVWVGLRSYRRWQHERGAPPDPAGARPRVLLALGGWVLSLIFSLLIVLSLVQLLLLRPCAWS